MIDANTYYRGLYDGVQPEFACTASTEADLSAWQNAFRPALRDAIGLTRMEKDLESFLPRFERTETEPMDGYVRERWSMEAEPGMRVPFYLLRPDGARRPRPLVLCPHGHNAPHLYVGLHENEKERVSIIEGERDIAVQAVREGYLAIAPTTRGFGETRTEDDAAKQKLSSCRIELMHGLLLGRTPIGERVWDIMRLLDWACKNLEIDAARIGITGNSGGGTVSLFAAACDERISVAIPSSYFCTFSGSIGTIHHCDCNYVPGMLRLGEMWDVAGLIAPRPFCAVTGDKDEIFPVEETRKAYGRLLRIYTVAGVPEKCRLFVGDGGHRFYKAGAWPFFREHFGPHEP